MQPNNNEQQYIKTAGNLLPLYAELIAKYRILIYSGDVDACVPYYGTEEVSLESRERSGWCNDR